jgi:hypothetical protein
VREYLTVLTNVSVIGILGASGKLELVMPPIMPQKNQAYNVYNEYPRQ